MTDLSQRYLRQQDIVPPDQISQYRVTVIGVGAIGRQVAMQLTTMGIPWLQLIDPDFVEPVNLGAQGYFQDDLERPKIEATGDVCHQINHGLELSTEQARFRKTMNIGDVMFCCVDSIETRRFIWDTVKDRVDFFADGRMAAEVLRVLIVGDEQSHKHYPSTLFAESDAYSGSCTAKSTIFCANIAAGMMLSQFSRWLRRMPIDADCTLNLLATELSLPS